MVSSLHPAEEKLSGAAERELDRRPVPREESPSARDLPEVYPNRLEGPFPSLCGVVDRATVRWLLGPDRPGVATVIMEDWE
jgi:hypothetical protein